MFNLHFSKVNCFWLLSIFFNKFIWTIYILVIKVVTFLQILLYYITCFSFTPRSIHSKHLYVDTCAFSFDIILLKCIGDSTVGRIGMASRVRLWVTNSKSHHFLAVWASICFLILEASSFFLHENKSIAEQFLWLCYFPVHCFEEG